MNKYTETYLNELNHKRAFIGKALVSAGKSIIPSEAGKAISGVIPKSIPAVSNFGSKIKDFIQGGIHGAKTTTKGLGNVFTDPSLGKLDKIQKAVIGMYGFPTILVDRALKSKTPLNARELGFLAGTAAPATAASTAASIAANGSAIKDSLKEDNRPLYEKAYGKGLGIGGGSL
jgi:hypothetical protein